jgi:hypothetical protein
VWNLLTEVVTIMEVIRSWEEQRKRVLERG